MPVSPALLNYVTTTPGIHAEALIWITVRDFATGNPVTFGFWSGDDHETFTINGSSRLFYGAGALVDVSREPLQYEIGFDAKTWQFEVAMGAVEVETMVRGFDLNLAPVEVWRAVYNMDGTLIEHPKLMFDGRISAAPITDSEEGLRCSIQVTSSSVELTLKRHETRSDSVYRAIRSGDRIFRHVDVTRTAKQGNAWGTNS